jgi:hypothetical protein
MQVRSITTLERKSAFAFVPVSMANNVKTTPQSLRYRRRAAAMAREIEGLQPGDELFELLRQALIWIQMAEADEGMAAKGDLTPC